MYGKIFEQIYDGTLSENWQALITFQQMIVLCDSDGIVDMTPGSLSRRTGIPLEHIEEGIKFLEKPDPYSRTPDEEGKRIVRLDEHRPWGWKIVNHKQYRDLASHEDKKKADRERIAEKRKSQRVARSRNVSQEVADVAYTNTDTNTDTNKEKTYSASDDAVGIDGIDFLITKKKRKLNGKRWESFKQFWTAFDYKRGKREAADAWYDIPTLTNALVETILCQAKIEAKNRSTLLAKGKTPKMAQGWISGRRWEDETSEFEDEYI